MTAQGYIYCLERKKIVCMTADMTTDEAIKKYEFNNMKRDLFVSLSEEVDIDKKYTFLLKEESAIGEYPGTLELILTIYILNIADARNN